MGKAVLQQSASGLWAPVPLLTHRATTRTITMPSGERAKVTIDDSRTVKHIEHGDVLDCVVRPAVVRLMVVKRGT